MFSTHIGSSTLPSAVDKLLEEVFLQGRDPRPISFLLSRWYSDRERTMALRRMLLRSLCHLQPEHFELVTEAQRKQLYFELQRKRNDPYLVSAILKGLAGIEDRDAIPYIVPLAEGLRSAAEFPQVQVTARECLFRLGYFG